MPKQPNIRLTTKDKELIRKLNRNVQDKKRRISKNFGLQVDIETQQIGTFDTRAEFNAYVAQMKRFTNPNVQEYQYVRTDKDVVIQKSVAQKLQREIKRINAAKEREKKRLEKKGIKKTYAETIFNDPKFDHLSPLKFNINKFKNIFEFEEYRKKIEAAYKGDFMKRQNQNHKENYIKGLEKVFGDLSKPLQNKIEKMSLRKFMQYYYNTNLANIEFVYDLADATKKLEALEMLFK